jgi:hypothetical protein
MVFLGTILGFIVSKEGKVMDPKKIEALVNMLDQLTYYPPRNPNFQWDGIILRMFYQKNCLYYVTNHQTTQ